MTLLLFFIVNCFYLYYNNFCGGCMQAISIRDLCFNYGNIQVFKNLNINIYSGCFTTILGKNGSGKTTLANILAGNLKYKGKILVFNKSYNNNEIMFIDDFIEYDNDMVMDLLIKETSGLNKEEIRNKIFNISVEFNFSKCLDKKLYDLSFVERKLVVLGSYLIKGAKILILDNFFEGIDKKLKKEIIQKLKRLANKKNMTIVDFTNDSEDLMYADNIIIIGDGKAILKGSRKNVLEKEEIFEKYELELPFVVSLSDKLKFYDLIDKIYLDEKKLVDDLWK